MLVQSAPASPYDLKELEKKQKAGQIAEERTEDRISGIQTRTDSMQLIDNQLSQFKLIDEPCLDNSKSYLENRKSEADIMKIDHMISIGSDKKSYMNDSSEHRSSGIQVKDTSIKDCPGSNVISKVDPQDLDVSSQRYFSKSKRSLSKAGADYEVFGAFCSTSLPSSSYN